MPKNTVTVLKDGHSPYIVVRGRYYRPVFPKPYLGYKGSIGTIGAGEEVSVSVHEYGPLANVGSEVWFSHGRSWKPVFWEW